MRPEIEQLIEDVTVDCYNDDEERSAFIVAFDEHLGSAPVAARIAGFETDLIDVADGGDRRGLVAQVRHAERDHSVALYDVDLAVSADPGIVALLDAYRAWCRR